MSDKQNGWQIHTKINGQLAEITVVDDIGGISQLKIDTKEQALRRALIKMGWLPPRNLSYFRSIWEVIKWAK